MGTVLAIDPGVHGAGCAIFLDGVLLRAAYVRNPVKEGGRVARCMALGRAVGGWVNHGTHPPVTRAVFEWPRVQLSSHQKGSKRSADPNDLLPLVGVDVAIASVLPADAVLEEVEPFTWKDGNLDKEIMCRRIWKRLSDVEKAVVERTPRGGGLHFDGVEGGIKHDVLDACGVGLWATSARLERHRVIA